MSISAISSFSSYSQYFNPLTVQLSDDPQSRYTIVRVSLPERPRPPSPPSIDPFSPPKVDAVPEELQEDSLFQEHTDPISYEPILDPVADKNEPKHIYERANIVRWLQTHNTSPLTRRPMTEADLVPVPELKEKINEKIQAHLLQKHPELLQKHKEKVEEAEKQYQEALDLYYEVDLPHYASEYRSLPCQTRVSLAATRCFPDLGNSLSPQFNGLQSLQGRVSVISANHPLASRVQNIVGAALGTSQPDKAFNPFAKELKSPDYTKYVNEIIKNFINDMECKYGLHCYGSGGSMPKDVEKIDVLFISYQKSTIQDARKMEVNAVQELLQRINTHAKIRPYLREYPFGSDRVHVSISFRTETDDRPLDGSVALVSLVKNKIFYDAAEMQIEEPTPLIYMNEKNEVVKEFIGGGPKEKLISLMDETYEEALKIVGTTPRSTQK
jgi:hypothetical protein